METKESVLEKRIKKSELRASGIFDYEYLTRKHEQTGTFALYDYRRR